MTAPVESALVIGHRIAEDAIWSSGRCNWVGATTIRGAGRRPPAPAAAPLGADLYEGTSGVALFLAHLHAATGDSVARDTALGAIRLAIEDATTPRARTAPDGLYTGRLGVAVAAATCGRLLDDDALRSDAGRMLRGGGPGRAHGDDLTSGAAGVVVGLLVLAGELDAPPLRDRAVRVGEALESQAGRMPLTGMAHGEAGLVHAFAELTPLWGGAAGAVLRAARHEARYFDRATGNWADLRTPAGIPGGGQARSAMAWCHGAPGILLSRRRSRDVLGPDEHGDLAVAAATVRRWIDAAVASRPGDLSLCHGLTGNAEALLDATGDPSDRDRAAQVAEVVAETLRHGDPLECGTRAGETPALMLGTAGIGLFCLRLADPSIPSVLAIAPGAGLT